MFTALGITIVLLILLSSPSKKEDTINLVPSSPVTTEKPIVSSEIPVLSPTPESLSNAESISEPEVNSGPENLGGIANSISDYSTFQKAEIAKAEIKRDGTNTIIEINLTVQITDSKLGMWQEFGIFMNKEEIDGYSDLKARIWERINDYVRNAYDTKIRDDIRTNYSSSNLNNSEMTSQFGKTSVTQIK